MRKIENGRQREISSKHQKIMVEETPLHLELKDAHAECQKLLKRFNQKPSLFGIVETDTRATQLLTDDLGFFCTEEFLRQWLPLEERYLRAESMLQRFSREPEIFLSAGVVRCTTEETREIVEYELWQEVAYRKIKPINDRKQSAKSHAQEIAKDNWSQDFTKSLRISVMAKMVWDTLIDEGFNDELPNDATGIRAWIRPVAPEYAAKPGAPSKHIFRENKTP